MDKIVVLDFGGQYAHLIANRVRRLKVYSEIKSSNVKPSDLDGDVKGVILSGGPASVYSSKAPAFNKKIFELGIPVLGICYGHQLMAHSLNGVVKRGRLREYGNASLEIKSKKTIFRGLSDIETIWMSHGDSVAKLPPGFKTVANTQECPVAAMADDKRKFYGFQFHPEVTHTVSGTKILSNFIYNICKCKPSWTMKKFIPEACESIRGKVGGKKVIILISGGVDSAVAAALLVKALGEEKVYGIHIDIGLMRKNESVEVEKSLRSIGFKNLTVVDASDEFFKALEGQTYPEKKREIIGNLFIDVTERNVEKLGLGNEDWMLGQGTIYPDRIESGITKDAAVIKSHHNVNVGRILELKARGWLVEPLDELYKDEVRELGLELGLPPAIVHRHPFPGPGLGVRILCAEKEYHPKSIDRLDKTLESIVGKYGLKARVLPIKSVGVQGDARTYANPLCIIGDAGWDVLEKASTEVTNTLPQINRCVYLLSPEAGFSFKKGYVTRDRVKLCQEADKIMMDFLEDEGFMDYVWQCPVVLLPLVADGGAVIVLRPVLSKEAMTARFAPLPLDSVKKVEKKIRAIDSIGAVLYDITHKPPGTIEWE